MNRRVPCRTGFGGYREQAQWRVPPPGDSGTSLDVLGVSDCPTAFNSRPPHPYVMKHNSLDGLSQQTLEHARETFLGRGPWKGGVTCEWQGCGGRVRA